MAADRECWVCGTQLIPPNPPGEPGDDTWYCPGCGRPWLTLPNGEPSDREGI
jgi:hypothetical protein